MFKNLFVIALVVGVVWGVLHFTPDDVKLSFKEKAVATISQIIPEKTKNQIESLVYTPSERRAKLLKQLEENISAIKNSLGTSPSAKSPPASSGVPSSSKEISSEPTDTLPPPILTPEEIIQKIEESQKLLKEIDDHNSDQTIWNQITTKVLGDAKTPATTSTCLQK